MTVRQAHDILAVRTRGQGLTDITHDVAAFVRGSGITDGLLTLFIQHTSASLTIQENADPDVVLDLRDYFERLVPEDESGYRHTLEGPDDMTSHIRSALTATSLSIPIVKGEMALGTWQGVYLFEHRTHPHRRHVVAHVIGE